VTFGRIQGILFPILLLWSVLFHYTFDPWNEPWPWEKETLISHIPPCFIIYLNSYSWILDRCSPSYALMTLQVVIATGPGNPPLVWVWTAKTGQRGSRPVQKPDPRTLGGPNPDPYPSTRGFPRVWLDPSVPISCSASRVSHLSSLTDMLLLIVKYWHSYAMVHF